MMGLRGDRILVGDEIAVELRGERVVGEHPLVRHGEVGRRILMRHVDVLRVLHAGWSVVARLFIEAIHAAVHADGASGS
ncbi:MAG TPA: hypothetical protein VGG70_12055, partial [Candidatus Cybelea sp.]